MISDMYQSDLERHLFAPAPRPERSGRSRRQAAETMLAWFQALLMMMTWEQWSWR